MYFVEHHFIFIVEHHFIYIVEHHFIYIVEHHFIYIVEHQFRGSNTIGFSGQFYSIPIEPASVRLLSIVPPPFSKISETAWPIKAKFYVKPPWEGETKVCINGLGFMTKLGM